MKSFVFFSLFFSFLLFFPLFPSFPFFFPLSPLFSFLPSFCPFSSVVRLLVGSSPLVDGDRELTQEDSPATTRMNYEYSLRGQCLKMRLIKDARSWASELGSDSSLTGLQLKSSTVITVTPFVDGGRGALRAALCWVAWGMSGGCPT